MSAASFKYGRFAPSLYSSTNFNRLYSPDSPLDFLTALLLLEGAREKKEFPVAGTSRSEI